MMQEIVTTEAGVKTKVECEEAIVTFDLFDYMGAMPVDCIELRMLDSRGVWNKIIDVPITADTPIWDHNFTFHPVYKLVLRGQRDQSSEEPLPPVE